MFLLFVLSLSNSAPVSVSLEIAGEISTESYCAGAEMYENTLSIRKKNYWKLARCTLNPKPCSAPVVAKVTEE